MSWTVLERRKGRYDWCECDGCGIQQSVRRDILYQGCRDCSADKRSLYPGATSEMRRAYGDFKHTCKQRELELGIDIWEYWELINQACYICQTPGPGGIDRVDNQYGYVQGNCAPCCWPCNKAKGDISIDLLYAMTNAVLTFMENKV